MLIFDLFYRPRLRRQSFRLAIQLVVACALSLLPMGEADAARAAAPTTKQLKTKKGDLGELRQRIEQLKKEMSASESAREEAADQLREQERSISEVQRDLHELAAQRDALRRRIGELGKEMQQAEARLGGHQTQIERLLVQHYMTGVPGPARLLLSGENPNQITRDLGYLGHIGEARRQLAVQTSTLITEKAQLADRALAEATTLAAIEARQQAQKDNMLRQRAERKQTLNRIATRLNAQRREIDTLKRNEQRLSRLVDRLGKLIAARAKAAKPPRPKASKDKRQKKSAPHTPPEAAEASPAGAYPSLVRLKGRLPAPTSGNITQRFGAPVDGSMRSKGVFFATREDSPVLSIAAGQVVFADWMRGFGNLLVVDHDNGFLSIYGYNEAVLKQVGDEVRAGEIVATAGNTGGRPETGLYFELRRQGEPLDPSRWLAR